MAELKYVLGDATNPRMEDDEMIFIPHICNNKGLWGAGFVLALSKKWKIPEQRYRSWLCSTNSIVQSGALGIVQSCQVAASGKYKNTHVVNMIAQNGVRSPQNPKPIKYVALVKAMECVVMYVEPVGGSIHCPKFGSGLAGGDWRVIEALIQEIWVDAGINVTVYEYGSSDNYRKCTC